jgi:hypothetical protein
VIFSVQRFLENYFHRCGLIDTDEYAINLATLYDGKRQGKTARFFLGAMKQLRTTFYRKNGQVRRQEFETKILNLLDREFKKKGHSSSQKRSPQGLKLRASV